jgi:TorA maturation chaperone TorD
MSRTTYPLESVWCDTREVDGVRVAGLLHGESAGAVARVYARHRYALTLREQPDHLGCELAFLATLEERAAAAEFAREHPGRFVGRVAEHVGGDREARFYPAVLSLAAVLVARVAG